MIRTAPAEKRRRFQVSVSVRSVFSRPISILTILMALTVPFCTPVTYAKAQSTQDDSAAASPPDERLASLASQLESLNQNIRRWGCDRPQYATSVVGLP